jgi:hypothetical protein
MGKVLEKLFTLGLTIYGIGWAFASLIVFGVAIYITKLFVDRRKPEYTDGEKAGIYIGVSIPAFFLSFYFSRFAIYAIAFIVGLEME